MLMKDMILDAAEKRVRAKGFVAVSFRDIASDVGIKSASVHYYFPAKQDLGEALVARYAAQFKVKLDEIDQSSLRLALESYADLFAKALVLNESICLCAMMGAESIGLPENVNKRTREFFLMNKDWLEALLRAHDVHAPESQACMVVSALEGAMIVASALNDRSLFDIVANGAVQCVMAK